VTFVTNDRSVALDSAERSFPRRERTSAAEAAGIGGETNGTTEEVAEKLACFSSETLRRIAARKT